MDIERDTANMSSNPDETSHGSIKDHVEHNEKPLARASDDENTFEVDSEELPPGYFKSPFFLGSMTGIALGLLAGVAGFGFAAPILGLINNDIGPVRHCCTPPWQ